MYRILYISIQIYSKIPLNAIRYCRNIAVLLPQIWLVDCILVIYSLLCVYEKCTENYMANKKMWEQRGRFGMA